MVEPLELFIQSYDKVVIFFPFFKSYLISVGRSYDIMRKTWFLRFSRSLLINYLITLSPVKRNYFGKKSGESLGFLSKNLYVPCGGLNENCFCGSLVFGLVNIQI